MNDVRSAVGLRCFVVAGAILASACTDSAPTTSPTTTASSLSRTSASAAAEPDLVGGQALDLAEFAAAVGASTVVVEHEGVVHIVDDDVHHRIENVDEDWSWADKDFVYVASGLDHTYRTTAYTHGGAVACETVGSMHHAARRPDGSFVMAIEDHQAISEWDGTGSFPVPVDAVDCETGERQPIESLSSRGGDGETGFVFSLAGRTFIGTGDAEGNVDIVNEDGVSINSDDYAGYHAFSDDASLVVYGDMSLGGGPHFSPYVTARDTVTGEELWMVELPDAFVHLAQFGDRVAVGLPESNDALISGDLSSAKVLLLDARTGETVMEVPAGFRLLHLGA